MCAEPTNWPTEPELPDPKEPFESLLLLRVAQAVEAGEVPADLLTELRGEFEAAKDRP